jgi:tRNA nucleotidyltransferase/poly(A) polymerase
MEAGARLWDRIPERLQEGAQAVAVACARAGGRAWLVGGAVRDVALQRPVNDLDLEIHGLTREALTSACAALGQLKAVGQAFGVLKLKRRGIEFDLALPRGRSTGTIDAMGAWEPYIGINEALRRRDLRINAMALDPLSGELVDPWGGWEDLTKRQLGAVDPEGFAEDPLRVLRVARFAAALDFQVLAELVALCQSLNWRKLPAERLIGEIERMILGPRPSRAAEVLITLGVGELVPRGAVEALAREETRRSQEHTVNLGEGWMAWLGPDGGAVASRLGLGQRAGVDLRKEIPDLKRLVGQSSWTDKDVRTLAETIHLERGLSAAALWGDGRLWAHRRQQAADLGVLYGALPRLVGGKDMNGRLTGPELGELLRGVREAQLAGEVSGREEALALLNRLWSERVAMAAAVSPPACGGSQKDED